MSRTNGSHLQRVSCQRSPFRLHAFILPHHCQDGKSNGMKWLRSEVFQQMVGGQSALHGGPSPCCPPKCHPSPAAAFEMCCWPCGRFHVHAEIWSSLVHLIAVCLRPPACRLALAGNGSQLELHSSMGSSGNANDLNPEGSIKQRNQTFSNGTNSQSCIQRLRVHVKNRKLTCWQG